MGGREAEGEKGGGGGFETGAPRGPSVGAVLPGTDSNHSQSQAHYYATLCWSDSRSLRKSPRNRVKYRATTAERLQRVKHSVETEHPAPCQRVNQAPTTVRNQCHPAGAGRIAAGLARTPGALVLLCVCPARLGPPCRQGGRSSAGQAHTRTVRVSPSQRSHSSLLSLSLSHSHISLSQSRGATAPCRRRPPCTKPVTADAQSGVWPLRMPLLPRAAAAASAASLRLPLWAGRRRRLQG